MRFGLAQSAAVVMIAGSVLFLVAAFLPISARVFPKPPGEQLAAIQAAHGEWVLAQWLFGAGAVVTALGVALLAIDLGAVAAGWLAGASAVVLFAGSVPWVVHVVQRANDPAAFADRILPAWTYLSYFFLTVIGLALLAVALLVGPFPVWVGWVVAGWAALLLVVALAIGDLPPLLFYFATVLVGVVVLVQAARSPA